NTGLIDNGRTADSSGYFNTARVVGFVNPNLLSGPTSYDGLGQTTVIADSPGLAPAPVLRIGVAVKMSALPDCRGNNHWRLLTQKGNFAPGPYSLVLEEQGAVHLRVHVVGGAEYNVVSQPPLPVGDWGRIVATYDAATGSMRIYVNGHEAGRSENPPAAVVVTSDALWVGGPNQAEPACPDGAGGFAGQLDLLDIGEGQPAPGVVFPAKNNGLLGKAAELDGTGRLVVDDAESLNPVNAISMEMAVKSDEDPDCDGNNNWRVLMAKGGIPDAGAYSMVLEEDRTFTARVKLTGGT